jgi:hypothetical protein
MSTNHDYESLKVVVDAMSLTVVLGTLAQWLPPIAAFVSIVWGCIRIYETETVKNLLKKQSK